MIIKKINSFHLVTKLIFFFFLVSFSQCILADTYSAIWNYVRSGVNYSSGQAACDPLKSAVPDVVYAEYPTMPGTYYCTNAAHTGNYGFVSHVPSCPAGGTYDHVTQNCVNAPACIAPEIRNATTGMCGPPLVTPDCEGVQTPLTTNCKYPADKGNGINCADGSTVYVPLVCPPTGSRWEDIFPAPKHMCSPFDTDHTNCTPSIFQRIDDFASSHAIQYATAILAIAAIPELAVSSEIATIIGGVSVEARAVWNGVFHNSAGEIVDVKVAGDVPSTVMGDAISDFIKTNPTDPYSSQFPEVYNTQAPQAPIVVEPNTGVIHPVDSTVPLSSNQIAVAATQLAPILLPPYVKIAPYIIPENIPWIVEAQAPINYDISHQQAPVNYPELTRATNPLQSSSPYFQISPNPLETAPLFPAATPQSITGIQPFTVFNPLTPSPLAPPVSTTTQPPAQYNQNPTGTDAQTSPSSPPPDPETPIDPNTPDLPPTPPTIYSDTWKYFDFLPMTNPFLFDVSNLLPALPETSCTYEIHRTFHVPLLGEKHFDFAPCVPLQPLRVVLDWVFGVITIWVCFSVIFRSTV